MEDFVCGEAIFTHLLSEFLELLGEVVDFFLVSLADRRNQGKFARFPQRTVRLRFPLRVDERLVEAEHVVGLVGAVGQAQLQVLRLVRLLHRREVAIPVRVHPEPIRVLVVVLLARDREHLHVVARPLRIRLYSGVLFFALFVAA